MLEFCFCSLLQEKALSCISSGSALFAEVRAMFRDLLHDNLENPTSEPLNYIMDNPILIAFICMGSVWENPLEYKGLSWYK